MKSTAFQPQTLQLEVRPVASLTLAPHCESLSEEDRAQAERRLVKINRDLAEDDGCRQAVTVTQIRARRAAIISAIAGIICE